VLQDPSASDPQEVAGLRMQKEVLARAIFLGCTVHQANTWELGLIFTFY